MDLGKSFTYMFEDKDWIVKILIGGGIILLGAIFSWVLLIPLIAAFSIVLGYYVLVLRNVYEGSATPLPEWTNFGDLFSKGIGALGGGFIWSLPAIILTCCGYIPIFISGSANRGDGGAGSLGILGLLGTCILCLAIIVGIATALFIYAPLTNYALTNQISTFWDFRGNWNFIRNNSNNYLIAFLLAIVASIGAGLLGGITCGLLGAFTGFWAYLVAAHLFGQVARANMVPPDAGMLPPAPPMPPSEMQGPFEPAPSA